MFLMYLPLALLFIALLLADVLTLFSDRFITGLRMTAPAGVRQAALLTCTVNRGAPEREPIECRSLKESIKCRLVKSEVRVSQHARKSNMECG